jgi:hypothetical protein
VTDAEQQRDVWIAAVIAAVRPLVPRTFWGSLEVNVAAGGITSVNVKQSFKPSREDR